MERVFTGSSRFPMVFFSLVFRKITSSLAFPSSSGWLMCHTGWGLQHPDLLLYEGHDPFTLTDKSEPNFCFQWQLLVLLTKVVPVGLLVLHEQNKPSCMTWSTPAPAATWCPLLPNRCCDIPSSCWRLGWNKAHYSAGFRVGANNISRLRHREMRSS